MLLQQMHKGIAHNRDLMAGFQLDFYLLWWGYVDCLLRPEQ
jgi:hypothetical protein